MTDLRFKTLFAVRGKSSLVALFVACCAVFGVAQIGQGFYATTNAQHSVLRLGESAVMQEGVSVQTLAFQHIGAPGPTNPGTSLVAANGETDFCSLKQLAVGNQFDVVLAGGQKVTLKVTSLEATTDWQAPGTMLDTQGSALGLVACQSLAVQRGAEISQPSIGKTPERKL